MNTALCCRRAVVHTTCLLMLAVLVLLVSAASAWAAPAEPTLSIVDLKTKLESGPMTGYLKTVVHGYAIEQVPVTVEATTEWSNGTLIVGVAERSDHRRDRQRRRRDERQPRLR